MALRLVSFDMFGRELNISILIFAMRCTGPIRFQNFELAKFYLARLMPRVIGATSSQIVFLKFCFINYTHDLEIIM